MSDVTRILSAIEQGDPSAAEQLLPLVYDELRKLAAAKLAQERPGQTLDATALVHEAYVRLVGAPPGGGRGRTISRPGRGRPGGGSSWRRPAGNAVRSTAADCRTWTSSWRTSSPRCPTRTCSPSTRP